MDELYINLILGTCFNFKQMFQNVIFSLKMLDNSFKKIANASKDIAVNVCIFNLIFIIN